MTKNENLVELEVIDEIVVSELNDFEALFNDFLNCGYSEDEAEQAANNVLEQDKL
jgi:hypothetical protein